MKFLVYQEIKLSLDKLDLQHKRNINSDPIHFPLRFSNSKDREVVALISAMYAFGNVKMIFKTLENILLFLGPTPHQKLLKLTPRQLVAYPFVTHRWIKPSDTHSFLMLLKHILQKHETLETSFMQLYQSSDPTLEQSLIQWMKYLQETCSKIQKRPLTRGQKFLLSSPGGGSTSKRIVMFFRWMVRRGQPDLGLWKGVSPSQLLMPLDTHLFRFSQYLGFTKQKQADWKAVIEATRHFREISPDDPVQYDFSLARLGILNLCIHKVDLALCGACPIQDHCKLFAKSTRRSAMRANKKAKIIAKKDSQKPISYL
jgi:uncharacterized protein (TIGR02757 family)